MGASLMDFVFLVIRHLYFYYVFCHRESETANTAAVAGPPQSRIAADIFTARRYASAVLAVIVCLCVCLSVRHKPVLYQNGYR